jgi:hypothetical protein
MRQRIVNWQDFNNWGSNGTASSRMIRLPAPMEFRGPKTPRSRPLTRQQTRCGALFTGHHLLIFSIG